MEQNSPRLVHYPLLSKSTLDVFAKCRLNDCDNSPIDRTKEGWSTNLEIVNCDECKNSKAEIGRETRRYMSTFVGHRHSVDPHDPTRP